MYMRGGADESTLRFTEMCTPDISVIPAPSVRPSYLYSRSLYSWANNAILKTFVHPHLIVRFWELWTKVCPITLLFSYTGSTRTLWILWPALDIAHPGIQIECEWLTSNTSQESWKLAKYGWIHHWAHSIPVFLGAISLTRVTCAILKHLKQMQTSADASNSQPFLHLLAKFILQWVERHLQEYHSRNSFGRELCCCSSVLLRKQYPIKIKLGIDSISGEHG